MGNVSSSNNNDEKVPRLRFPKFYEPWKTFLLKDIFTEIIEKNCPKLPVLSILQGKGTVLRDTSERRISYDKANLNGYKAMKKGDFIIHLRSFEGGLECSNHEGISSPAYKILRTEKLLPAAYKDYFRSYSFINGKLSTAVTGIRDGKNIDMPSFWNIKIFVPKIEEQQKISAFLTLLDKRITKQRELVEALKSYKRGALKAVFSQITETCTLGDISEYKSVANTFESFAECKKGEYPLYDASGISSYIDKYDFENSYVAIVKDGSGVGRLQYCTEKTSIIVT